jgi:hypothetical protein
MSGPKKGRVTEPQRYEHLPLEKASHLDLLIRFDKKKKCGKWIKYAGKVPKISGTFVEEVGAKENKPKKPRCVMVSYDALAIYADKVRFNRNTLTLKAEGNVVIEDGVERIHREWVQVSFKGTVPKLSVN